MPSVYLGWKHETTLLLDVIGSENEAVIATTGEVCSFERCVALRHGKRIVSLHLRGEALREQIELPRSRARHPLGDVVRERRGRLETHGEKQRGSRDASR